MFSCAGGKGEKGTMGGLNKGTKTEKLSLTMGPARVEIRSIVIFAFFFRTILTYKAAIHTVRTACL
jgi:hypothetical protein